MSARGMQNGFEFEDSGQVSERNNYASRIDGFSSSNRLSYQPGTPNRTYTNTRRSFADDFGDDYSKEKRVTYRDVRMRDLTIEKLKQENKRCQDELHKYKKMEVGMSFGSNNKKTFEIADLKMNNKDLIEEINRLKTVILDLESRTAAESVFVDQNNQLKNIISQLEQEKSSIIVEIERIRNASETGGSNQQTDVGRELSMLRENLESERRKVESIRSEMNQLASENKNLKTQMDRNRGAEIKASALENKINYLSGLISNLEKENRQLQEQLSTRANPPVSFGRDRDLFVGNDPQMISRLQENISNLESRLRQETSKGKAQNEEIEGLRSKIMQLEVQASANKKKPCPYHTDEDAHNNEESKILKLFKEKFEEKLREVGQLHDEIERLNNQNQDLRTKLSTIEVHFEATKNSHQNRDKDLVTMYKLNLEEARIQADYLIKENSKLKELLKKSETHFGKVDTPRTVSLMRDSMVVDPRIEKLILKGLLAEFEFSRLKKASSETLTAKFSDKRSPTSFGNLNGPRLEYMPAPESITNSRLAEQGQINGLLFSQESQKIQRKASGAELTALKTQLNSYK